jgi:serine/threonine protein kinase
MNSATQIPISYDDFLRRLRESQILSEDQVNSALARFEASCSKESRAKDPARSLGEWLVRSETLTLWQVRHLRSDSKRPLLLGSYRLLTHLGSGGMSQVYLAEHTKLHRQVAIKILPESRVADKSYLRRFQREARAVAQLDHPNIVRAYSFDEQGDTYYLIMEYVPGTDLDRLVRKGQPLSVEQTLNYLRQTLHGLAHAHAKGMVHRDIKPANLLIDSQGTIKILDFGLARLETAKTETSVTMELNERVLGTADFMAPEQAIDSHSADARADFYSLGCTLYFLLTGREPFGTGTIAQRLVKHQLEEPTPESEFRDDIPDWLIAIRQRLMAKKPENRYPNAEAVLLALETKTATPPTRSTPPIRSQSASETVIDLASHPTVIAPRPTPASAPPKKRPASSHWIAYAMGGGALAVVALLVAMMSSGTRETPVEAPSASIAEPTMPALVMPQLPPLQEEVSSPPAGPVRSPVPTPPPVAPPRPAGPLELVFHWQLTADRIVNGVVQPLQGGLAAEIQVPVKFLPTSPKSLHLQPEPQARKVIMVSENMAGVTLPTSQISVESWVRVDAGGRWGGIISARRVETKPQTGWMLAYSEQRFIFILASESSSGFDKITARDKLELGRWYHVVGVYDGQALRLYVDGQLASMKTNQTGDIRNPKEAKFVLGAMWDAYNFAALNGSLYSASIWSGALDEAKVRERYEAGLQLEPGLAN